VCFSFVGINALDYCRHSACSLMVSRGGRVRSF
jgi:hypothetical protein